MALVVLNDKNFKKTVLDSKLPFLVDFWAEWCLPCKMLSPIMEEIADEYEGRLKVGKINVDESSGTASYYGIMSIPTVMFFKDGKVINQIVGAVGKPQLKKKIDELLRE